MSFHDLLSLLQAGEGGETIYDDLTASYNERDSYASSADAKIAELTASVEELTHQINQLKAVNYDLLMQVGNNEPNAPEPEPQEENISISDLFEE